jgi:hypothetical protein
LALGGVAGGHGSIGLKYRLELRERFHRGVGARPFIFLENPVAMLGSAVCEHGGIERHRHDLFVELAFRLRAQGILVASEGELIGILSADAEFAGYFFGREAHAHVDLGQMVDHPWIGREFISGHRNHAHGFGAARDDDLSAAGADAVGGHGDRLQSRRAEAVDGDAGNGVG